MAAEHFNQQIDQKVDAALAKLGTTSEGILGSIKAYKGHFTRELKDLDAELTLASETDPTQAVLQRVLHQQAQIEFRYRLISKCYSMLVKLFPNTSEDAINGEEEVYQKYKKADREIFACTNHIQFQMQYNKDEQAMEVNKTINAPQ